MTLATPQFVQTNPSYAPDMSKSTSFTTISFALVFTVITWMHEAIGFSFNTSNTQNGLPPFAVPKRYQRYGRDIKPNIPPPNFRRERKQLGSVSRQEPRSGNTFDECGAGDRCNVNRTCATLIGEECTSGDFCLCQPNVLSECVHSQDCAEQEVCGDLREQIGAAIPLRPVCVSDLALIKIGDIQLNDPPPVPGDGLSFSRCLTDSDCEGVRVCAFRADDGTFEVCGGRSPCYCQSTEPLEERFCLTQSECDRNGVCANTVFPVPECVSKEAEKKLHSVNAVPDIQKGGFTFDPCDVEGDCSGDRMCSKIPDSTPCGGGERCACLPKRITLCLSLANCVEEEVCVRTPFVNGTICVSQAARKAYQFSQIVLPGVCPVLISEDPPISSRQLAESSRELAESSIENAVRTAQPRIVGGLPISPNLAPFLVALRDPDNNRPFYCTGTLISKRFVLTAAHCGPQEGSIVAALTTSGTQGGVEIGVEKVFSHPKFFITEDDLYFDFSILQLAEDAPPGSKFMKLNTDPTIPANDSPIRALGYGVQFEGAEAGGPGGDFSLRQVDVLTVSPEKCRAALRESNIPRFSKRLQICAGVPRGGCDSCQGDSGGPIIQYQNGEPIHIGLSSFGVGCGRPDFPGGYARTSALVKWVEKNTPASFSTN